jgi:hypothetical protein
MPGAGFEVMEASTFFPHSASPNGLITTNNDPSARRYSPAPKRLLTRRATTAIHLGSGHGQDRSPPRPQSFLLFKGDITNPHDGVARKYFRIFGPLASLWS